MLKILAAAEANEEFIVVDGNILLLAIAILLLAWFFSRRQKKRQDKMYGKGEFLFQSSFPFVSGLNLPSGITCSVICLKSRVIFFVNKQEISLSVSKIVDISVMTNTQIQQVYSPDYFGAAMGGALYGTVGAIVGGSPTRRDEERKIRYLVFSYMDGNEIKYVLFEADKRLKDAEKLIKKYRGLISNGEIRQEL